MAKWNQIVITDAGYQLSAQTLAGKRIQYTHAQTTDKDMSAMTSDQLKAVTKLDDVVQDLSIGIVTVQDDHTVNVPVTVANQDLAADYLLSAMAIYAKPVDPTDGDEILYGIATAVTPDLIPKQDGTTVVGTNFKLKLHVGRADNVEIIITPDGSVSNDELMGILKNYLTQADLNKALPDTIIDSSKPADFKEPVTFEKGAVDGAGNTIATTKNVADGDAMTLKSAKEYADTKTSGKADDSTVVHTADMRKPANQVASIDEVNAKVADNKDDSVTINGKVYVPANDANMFHRSPDTGAVTESGNFPELQVKGVDVATAADLKRAKLTMWHEIELPDMFTGSPILMKYNPVDKTTMIMGAKNATLDDVASWTGTLFTLPEGFHWISTDSKMMPLYNMDSHNDNVSGRLYNTKLSRNGTSSDGSKFGIWFTALSRSLISIDKPYTVVNSIQPD